VRRMTVIVAMGGLLMAGTLAQSAEPLKVNLTVQERLGVARVNEPVTSGVPLPKGAVEDPKAFRLLDASGQVVPATFVPATYWWPTKSIKWVHVNFLASVPAKGAATYTLETGAPGPEAKTPLSVEKNEAGYTVSTGPLKFTVKAKGFNLFDEVWLDGRPLVKSHAAGITLTNAAGAFSPAHFADTKITVEEQTSLKAVLLVVTRNVAEDGSGYALDSKIRIYAWAGSPLVKVVYTVESRRGKWADHVDVADWRLVLPTALGPGLTARFGMGAPEQDVETPLAAGAAQRLDVTFTHNYEFSGPVARKGDPHAEDPARFGALDLSGPDGGVTVAVRNFWQLWAKYLAADGSGTLTVGLWTDKVLPKGDVGKTTLVDEKGQVQFFAGIAKTQDLYFRFHGPGEADSIAPVAAVAHEPLFARCDPYWYCRGTKVWGDLAEADPAVFADAWKPAIATLNTWAEGSVKNPLKRWKTDSHITYVDSYGLLNYGDGIEEKNDGLDPERVHWEGGYYDYPHSVYLQFARTGDPFYLWLATDMSQHNAEIHHTHHDTSPGNSRYCPSWAHIIMDAEVKKDAAGKVIDRGYYASGTFNHWKNWSAFDRWYLLGDHRAKEAGLEITQFALRLGNSGIDFGQPRSICHGNFGFYCGWEATGEQKYMDAWTKFAQATAKRIMGTGKMGSGSWQRGMALQGLSWYVEITGDETIIPAIQKALDADLAQSPAVELAYASAYFWKRTQDPKYFYGAVRYLGGRPEPMWMQRFGNNGRSKLYVPFIVLKDAKPAPLPPKT
jgi:hypothetical protein